MPVVECEGNVTPRRELPAFCFASLRFCEIIPRRWWRSPPFPADVRRWCGSAMAERTLLSQSRKAQRRAPRSFFAASRKDLGKEFPERLREQSPAQLRASDGQKAAILPA